MELSKKTWSAAGFVTIGAASTLLGLHLKDIVAPSMNSPIPTSLSLLKSRTSDFLGSRVEIGGRILTDPEIRSSPRGWHVNPPVFESGSLHYQGDYSISFVVLDEQNQQVSMRCLVNTDDLSISQNFHIKKGEHVTLIGSVRHYSKMVLDDTWLGDNHMYSGGIAFWPEKMFDQIGNCININGDNVEILQPSPIED